MKNNKIRLFVAIILIMLSMQGCNLGPAPTEAPTAPPTEAPTLVPVTLEPTAILHQAIPASSPEDSNSYPDVTSFETASEKRAPYGDSYDINRLERPFTQDMTYIADLDISLFSISEDVDWYFVSVKLVGTDPNNSANIRYSLELDTDRDSFGDLLIVAEPPYSQEWTAENIKVYSDTNHNSAGNSASKSDAPFNGDGFDKMIASTLDGLGDLDTAWIRINAGPLATVQFAFKKSLSGEKFFYGVAADAGVKDVSRMDYVDTFSLEEAGSPIRSSANYPLKAVYAVDNTCFQAFGFTPTGFEPKVCPKITQPQVKNSKVPATPGVDACTAIGRPNPGNCPYGWADYPFCGCIPG